MSDTPTPATLVTSVLVSLPNAKVSVLQSDGTFTLPWRRAIEQLWKRTGGSTDQVANGQNSLAAAVAAAQEAATQALDVANAASADADESLLLGLVGSGEADSAPVDVETWPYEIEPDTAPDWGALFLALQGLSQAIDQIRPSWTLGELLGVASLDSLGAAPPSVQVFFGAGAPVTLESDGDFYFDTTTAPYAGYVQNAGAWVAFGGGGSGGTATYFGTGAPAAFHNQGDLYFDRGTTPYSGYVQDAVSGGASTPALDGAAVTSTWSGGASGSVNLSTAIANDLIAVAVVTEHAGSGPTCTGVSGGGLAFTRQAVIVAVVSGNQSEVSFWTAQAAGTLAGVTLTATLSAATDDAAMAAFGITGHDASAPFDPDPSVPATAPRTGSTPPSVTISTANANDLILYVYGNNNNSSGTVPSGGPTAWTNLFTVTNAGGSLYASLRVDYQLPAAALTGDTITCGQAGTLSGGMIVAAITGNSGGSSPMWEPFT